MMSQVVLQGKTYNNLPLSFLRERESDVQIVELGELFL